MKQTCPFKERERYCVHRREVENKLNKRFECGYKNQLNCEFFLEWIELNPED